MPQKEIEKLDDDVMQFIVDDLKSGGKHFEFKKTFKSGIN